MSMPGAPSSMVSRKAPRMPLGADAAKGDAPAMRQLLLQVGPRIARVVGAIVSPSHPDLDDIIQRSLLGFVHALPSFRGECSLHRFASRIAARTALAEARQRRKTSSRCEEDVTLEWLTSPSPEPLAEAERSCRMEMLRDALSRIRPELAETLTLRVALGWSFREAAERTGVPINTVRSRIRIAKSALRAVIDDDGPMNEEFADDAARRPSPESKHFQSRVASG
jgi:RNA polymerase sigma factor (sigma-70 family)